MIRDLADDLSCTKAMREGSQGYHTFNAHRLLHWAWIEGHQSALEHALFEVYFSDG